MQERNVVAEFITIYHNSRLVSQADHEFDPRISQPITLSNSIISVLSINSSLSSHFYQSIPPHPPPIAILIRPRPAFGEFMDKLYHLISYEKQYARFVMTCKYNVPKEYIALPIPDQKTLEIAFVVHPPENMQTPSRVRVGSCTLDMTYLLNG